ncbi:MAG: outer membrane beta-barrel protein [Opitutaceae bacterium]
MPDSSAGFRSNPRHRVLTAVLVLLGAATLGQAQGSQATKASANRWGTSEFYLGGSFVGGGTNILKQDPVTLDFDDDWNFLVGGGYNLNDNLYIGGEMNFANTSFTGTGYDPDTGEESRLTQRLKQWAILIGGEYNLLTGPVTPYVSAGLGFTYMETDVPGGDAELICVPGYWQWWCYWAYPVYSDWFFTYYAGAGLRWDVNDRTVVRLSYESNWINVSGLSSSPRQDVFSLTIGGKF